MTVSDTPFSAPTICSPSFNERLRDHAVELHDWKVDRTNLADLVKVFYRWCSTFNDTFDLRVPVPAIAIERLRRTRLGHYRNGRNGFGIDHEIAMNRLYLDRPLARQLGTLLHEMLHLWQRVHGKPSSSGRYHNKQFREKAREYGLLVDQRGYTTIVRGKFTELLESLGGSADDALDPPVAAAAATESKGSKNRKWSCGCTNIRCAVKLRARCLRCGNEFRLAPPSW